MSLAIHVGEDLDDKQSPLKLNLRQPFTHTARIQENEKEQLDLEETNGQMA